MNVENIRKTIDAIRAEKIARFDMSNWCVEKNHCGTAACIAGFAALIDTDHVKSPRGDRWSFFAIGDSQIDANIRYVDEVAQDFLGLTTDQAHDLFMPDILRVPLREVSAENAIKVLENLIETGDVDWFVTDLVE